MKGTFDKYNEVHIKYDHLSQCVFVIVLNTKDGDRCSGGTRMKTYSSVDEGVSEAIQLARSMSKKCSMIGPEFNGGFSGGKGVIIGDPLTQKTPEMLMRYGKFVNSLDGVFVTGTDLNIGDEDAQHMAKASPYIDGLSTGPIDDTAVGTTYGILFSIQKVLELYYDGKSLSEIKICVQGLGSIGMKLVELLGDEGAQMTVTDTSATKLQEAKDRFNVDAVSPEEIYNVECDIFSPNAIGGIINEENIAKLRCSFIIGSANNQLDLTDISLPSPLGSFIDREGAKETSLKKIDQLMQKRNIVYLPDYVVNIGGIYTSICEQRNKDKDYMLKTLEEIINRRIDRLHKLSIENKNSFLVLSEQDILSLC